MINEFRNEYYFLSNFYNSPIIYKGITYSNNESAFQAQKTLNNREQFSNLDASSSKKLGRKIKLREDWEKVKYQEMYNIVREKFLQNDIIKQKLLSTKDKYLQEGNTWGDKIWGTVNGIGQNKLGKILMRVRDEFRCEEINENCDECEIRVCVNCSLESLLEDE